MTKKLFLLLSILSIISCGKNESDDIFKTKSGQFASRFGNFVASFPTEPHYTVIDNQVGFDKFQIHIYRSTLGPQKVFTIEYNDYPEHAIKSLSNEQIYFQGVSNFANKMSENFILQLQEPIEQHGIKGQHFQLAPKESARKKGLNGFVIGRLFREGNRVYTITYIGVNSKKITPFMDSFRLLKPAP